MNRCAHQSLPDPAKFVLESMTANEKLLQTRAAPPKKSPDKNRRLKPDRAGAIFRFGSRVNDAYGHNSLVDGRQWVADRHRQLRPDVFISTACWPGKASWENVVGSRPALDDHFRAKNSRIILRAGSAADKHLRHGAVVWCSKNPSEARSSRPSAAPAFRATTSLPVPCRLDASASA